MSKKHSNIPIFIPHLGCPHNCTFCDQKTISGAEYEEIDSIDSKISTALKTVKSDAAATQIAFFGGSFTAIPRPVMLRCLEAAYKYIKAGDVSSIRLSTRPDAIDEEICAILKRYGVKNVELGVQSVNDAVLEKCRRGHTFEDTKNAVRLLSEYGFSIGVQMMIGLPLSSIEDEENCARFAVDVGAYDARVYPLLVLSGTELAADENYTPLTLEEAVERTARVLSILRGGGVNIIRIGLQESDGLRDGSVIGGPYHPAFGELAVSRVYRNAMEKICDSADFSGKEVVFSVGRGKTSTALGNKRANADYLISKYRLSGVRVVEKDDILAYNILL